MRRVLVRVEERIRLEKREPESDLNPVLPGKSAVTWPKLTERRQWLTTLIQINVAFQCLCLVSVDVSLKSRRRVDLEKHPQKVS